MEAFCETIDNPALRGDPASHGLIAACLAGDPDAQHRLFLLHKDRVYSLARFFAKNRDDAAEITQEVFVNVFRNLASFRHEAKFETWLYRIVANTAQDHARLSRRFLLFAAEFWRNQPDRAMSPEQRRAKSQIEERVRSAIASLPHNLRMPVVLRYLEDLSYDEISAALQLPPGTVAARLNRARKFLAVKLARWQKGARP